MTTNSIFNKSKYSMLLGRGKESLHIAGYSQGDAEKIGARLRVFTRDRLVHVGKVIGEGSVKHAIYRACDTAVGLILSALASDAGAHSRDIIQEASLACYGWASGRTATAMHPIIAALEGIESGDLWVLRIDIRRCDQTHKLAVRAVLYDGESGLPGNDFPDGYLPHVTMLVHLGPLLMPLIGAVNGRVGTN